MKLTRHIIAGGAGSLALWPFIGRGAAVFGLASVLIDFDHYLDFLYRNGFKNFSVRKMFAYYEALDRRFEKNGKNVLFLSMFHTGEFLILWYCLAAWLGSYFMTLVFWGMIFHLFFDFIYMAKKKCVFARAYFLTEYLIRRKLNPAVPAATAALFRAALDDLNEPIPPMAAHGGA